MFDFILKGIFRDRSRFLFPIIIISAGVSLMVFFLSFMDGYIESMIRQNARFETGHVKIVTKAYNELISQKPYDLGFLDNQEELDVWKTEYPQFDWAERITFGAILDKADSLGNSLSQGQVMGFALDLIGGDLEIRNLRLKETMAKGRLPLAPGEILLSDRTFEAMQLQLGDSLMLLGSTADGSMAFAQVVIIGTVVFGYEALDRGGIIMDLEDARSFLDMPGGSAEVLGFLRSDSYNDKEIKKLTTAFNDKYSTEDEYSPLMLSLSDQNGLGYILWITDFTFLMMSLVFILILGIVLWNSGLMSGIRRYGEFGIRLAIGEEKKHIYRSLILESLCIGTIGSLLGLLLGFIFSYPLSIWGLDMSQYGKTSTMVFENVIRTKLSIGIFITSFIPGICASLLGTALAGTAIYKRQTSQLFKELEQ
jgi:putative ABC transport system permease protein